MNVYPILPTTSLFFLILEHAHSSSSTSLNMLSSLDHRLLQHTTSRHGSFTQELFFSPHPSRIPLALPPLLPRCHLPLPPRKNRLLATPKVKLWTTSQYDLLPRIKQPNVVASAFLQEVMPFTAVALAGMTSFGALRIFIYFRLQYIIAAMLGRHVPRGGSKVLDLSIREGRNLYYYPDDVVEVVAIAGKQNYEVVKNQALRAGVKVDIRLKALGALGLPSNSMDAVVSVYGLHDVADDEIGATLHEVVRVLKPGKPFIFIENVEAEWRIVHMAQMLLQSTLRAFGFPSNTARNLQQYLEGAEGLEEMESEYVLGFQDPHVVGLARKRSPPADFQQSGNRRRGKEKEKSAAS